MKKILFIMFIVLILPIQVFAYSKEEVLEDIKSINNTYVSDDVLVKDLTITNDNITFNYDIEKLKNRYPNLDIDTTFNYKLTDKELIFEAGSGIITNNNYIVKKENISSYYLYLMLFNSLKQSYDEYNYFSKETIINRLNNETNTDNTIILKDNTNYFNVIIKKDNNTFKYYYQYNYTNEYIIDNTNINYRETDELENPYTGNFKMIIGFMLMGVIILFGYTITENEKKI